MKRQKTVYYGGLVGVVLSCYVLAFYHWLTAPNMLNDGMYVFVFAYSCPIGWFLGSTLFALKQRNSEARSLFATAGLVLCGAVFCVFGGPITGTVALMPVGLVIEALKMGE